jgi:hypothetical protein
LFTGREVVLYLERGGKCFGETGKEAVSSARQAGAAGPDVVVKQDKVVARDFGTSDEMYVEHAFRLPLSVSRGTDQG